MFRLTKLPLLNAWWALKGILGDDTDIGPSINDNNFLVNTNNKITFQNVGTQNSDYDPNQHPLKEIMYMALSPVGWVIFVFLLLLI